MAPPVLSRTRRDLVEATGRLWQLFSLPRSTGQIYGLLYLSPSAMSLDEIARQLSISKASASTGTRQLLGWQAVRQVWVPGDRRDHYEAVPDLRMVMKAGYDRLLKPKLNQSAGRLRLLASSLEDERQDGTLTEDEYRFCKERIRSMERFQSKALSLLPMAEKLL